MRLTLNTFQFNNFQSSPFTRHLNTYQIQDTYFFRPNQSHTSGCDIKLHDYEAELLPEISQSDKKIYEVQIYYYLY